MNGMQQAIVDVLTGPDPSPAQFSRTVAKARETWMDRVDRDPSELQAEMAEMTRLAYARYWRESSQ